MPTNENKQSLRHEIKENLSVSVPLITAQLIYALSSFLGTAFVAQLGEDALLLVY